MPADNAIALERVTPVLWVDDMDKTIAFYRDLLGFQCLAQVDGWACLGRDGVEIMLSLPNQHEPYRGPQFSGSFYFRTRAVDALWQQVKDKVPVVYPIGNFDHGMREFAIRDHNGYILNFGQEIE